MIKEQHQTDTEQLNNIIRTLRDQYEEAVAINDQLKFKLEEVQNLLEQEVRSKRDQLSQKGIENEKINGLVLEHGKKITEY